MYLPVATLLVVTSMANLLATTFAYPNGAPTDVCASMYPSHNGFVAQNTVAPYIIVVDSTCYTAGKQIAVTLRSNVNGTMFTGFFMQARKPNDNSSSYGTFSPAGNPNVSSIKCFGISDSAITHNTNPDITQTSFTWTPPATTALTGNIVLTTTVVEEVDEFWVQAVTLTLPPCSSPPPSSSWSLSSGAFSPATLLTISILAAAGSMGAL